MEVIKLKGKRVKHQGDPNDVEASTEGAAGVQPGTFLSYWEMSACLSYYQVYSIINWCLVLL